MPNFINSIWIFLLYAIGLTLAVSFAYQFLLSEEVQTCAKSVEDETVRDEFWIKRVLYTENTPQSQIYNRFLFVEQHCNTTLPEYKPPFTKLVFFIIDALRDDFVPTIQNLYATPRLPYMEQLSQSNGFGLVSIASIPTVTLARVKALISGMLPSFMDYILNLSAYQFNKDNIVEQLWRQKKRIVVYGDDVWEKLFIQNIFHRSNFTSSLFATDYTEVDSNVTYNVHRELKQLDDWDVMILHYLGVDHIGHLRGFYSDLFPAKLREMDDVFRNLYDTISFSNTTKNESYLIVVTGDHGMTDSGNHGGDTRDETHTALLFISSNKKHIRFNPENPPLKQRTVLQIDIAPTISSLMGIPFPSKSQGRVLSNVLERFEVSKSDHLCLLFQNSFQIQHLLSECTTNNASMLSYLRESIINHYLYEQERRMQGDLKDLKYFFELSRDAYQNFISFVQRNHVKQVTNRSVVSMYTVFIVGLYSIVGLLLYLECYCNPNSIIFGYRIKLQLRTFIKDLNDTFVPTKYLTISTINFSNLPEYFIHLRFFASLSARFFMLGLFMLNVIFMGSTSFMEGEHYFWHYLANSLLVIQLLLAIRGHFSFMSSKLNTVSVMQEHVFALIIRSLVALVLFKLMVTWKIPLISQDDLLKWDVHSLLMNKESKRLLSALYLISLVAIAFLTPAKSLSRQHFIFFSALFFVYQYRSHLGWVTQFKIPIIRKLINTPNTYAKLVYGHVYVIIIISLLQKIRSFLPINDPIRILVSFMNRLMGEQKTGQNTAEYNSLLHTFLIVWVTLATLMLDPTYVPVLALNLLMEKLIYFAFAKPEGVPIINNRFLYRQLFYRLGTYLIFAYSSFYQIGNSNSLSTINVNACFIGLDSYMLLPCTLLMTISIYSTFIYWCLMFFVRMQQDFMSEVEEQHSTITQLKRPPHSTQPNQHSTTDNTNRDRIIVLNYCTFYSSITCMLIIRLTVMAANLTATFYLRDHLFIWSVICPKLLYELVLTVIILAVTKSIAVLFTHDNYFRLH